MNHCLYSFLANLFLIYDFFYNYLFCLLNLYCLISFFNILLTASTLIEFTEEIILIFFKASKSLGVNYFISSGNYADKFFISETVL